MKIWHFLVVVAVSACLFAVALDPVGRVTLIVLTTGIVAIAVGLVAVMALFQTIGSLAMARGPAEAAQAIAATGFILLIGEVLISSDVGVGIFLVLASVR